MKNRQYFIFGVITAIFVISLIAMQKMPYIATVGAIAIALIAMAL